MTPGSGSKWPGNGWRSRVSYENRQVKTEPHSVLRHFRRPVNHNNNMHKCFQTTKIYSCTFRLWSTMEHKSSPCPLACHFWKNPIKTNTLPKSLSKAGSMELWDFNGVPTGRLAVYILSQPQHKSSKLFTLFIETKSWCQWPVVSPNLHPNFSILPHVAVRWMVLSRRLSQHPNINSYTH